MNFCDIEESETALKESICHSFGEQISLADVEQLKKEMDTIIDQNIIDPFYSRSEKVRYISLKKTCVSSDKTPYKLYLGAIVDPGGEPVFSQASLIYETEDILSGASPNISPIKVKKWRKSL